jgi:hypothetical protein
MVGKTAVTTAVMKVGSLVDNLVENWVANLAASSESLLAGLMVVRKAGQLAVSMAVLWAEWKVASMVGWLVVNLVAK